MCDLIEVECVKAECDVLAACRQSLAHGALLATRYILAEIDFNAGCKEGRAGQTELKVRIGFFFSRIIPPRPVISHHESPRVRVAAAKTKPRLPLLTKQ
jgi:hypothetical protein